MNTCNARHHQKSGRARRHGASATMWVVSLLLGACAVRPPGPVSQIEGIVWQPHNASIAPEGEWDKLGVRRLLVQWTSVEGATFLPNTNTVEVPVLPDWRRISLAPWAGEVILGLAGRFDEGAARAEMASLAEASRRLSQMSVPGLNVVGWYFPVEVDPTWQDAPRMATLLAGLPRPLWISVYDNSNRGAHALADSLLAWLPADVGVFFQDGVGVQTREAWVARSYADTLAARLGPQRLRLIAEVFRPAPGGGFRPATADEIKAQLAQYSGHSIYLFDGPNYLSDTLVHQLIARP